MYIQRDIAAQLVHPSAWVQVLLGPRQCGKSTLFGALAPDMQQITFDELSQRQFANNDPALFLQQLKLPLLLDEVQYVPNLFAEIKRFVDAIKKTAVFSPEKKREFEVLFYLTGSNQALMHKNVRETLVGRASYFYLNTLTVSEILRARPATKMIDILFKGGWPELYVNEQLSSVTYLNDYIRSYLEKEIAREAGIQKVDAFNIFLGLLAARTGQLLDYSNIASQGGVSAVTVKEWVSLLNHTDLIYVLPPYHSNLNKRLIKTPKIYFLDTGLAVRLQGWQNALPLLNSPQIGSLFETLVCAEIIKFIRNYRKDWKLFFWRTRDGEEIDFVLKTSQNKTFAFEAKFAIQNIPKKIPRPSAFLKEFSENTPLDMITFGGEQFRLSENCTVIPINALHEYLSGIDVNAAD